MIGTHYSSAGMAQRINQGALIFFFFFSYSLDIDGHRITLMLEYNGSVLLAEFGV